MTADQNMDRYLELFLEESTEQIDLLNDSLLLLEKEGPKPEIVEEIFRSVHTLKSSAAFVGQNRMSELAHKMEDLLQRIREGRLGIKTELINLFFQVVDRLRASLLIIANGEELKDEFLDLKAAIKAYSDTEAASGSSAGEDAKEASSPKTRVDPAPADAAKQASVHRESSPEVTREARDAQEGLEQTRDAAPAQVSINEEGLIELSEDDLRTLEQRLQGRLAYSGRVVIDPDAPMKNMRFLLLAENLVRQFEFFITDPPLEELEKETPFSSFRFVAMGNVGRDVLEKECQIDLVVETLIRDIKFNKEKKTLKTKGSAPAHQESHLLSKNIKVSSDKIDYLMNNVGELVILNSGLQKVYDDLNTYLADTGVLTELKGKIDQSGRIVRDLQSGIMKTRMMPVGLVFHRFARPIRDLAAKLNKKVELKLSGEDTELDKNIIDVLGEPLLHLMRNSLDHGIEPEEERLKRGKPATATLALQAYQSGSNVFIEVRDDGRGLDRDKILQNAISKGLVSADAKLSDDEVYELIFHPGFSTAEEVTDVSGRGVGMGVVSSLMEEFKGSVQIQNHPGEGCAMILSFPLTLAIISAVLVRLDSEEYAFPLADVVETIVIARDEITRLQGREIVNLRGEILSIYRLSELMGLPEEGDKEHLPLVIVNSGNRKVGFIVSDLAGKMEIVIKSLEQNFHSVEGLIGACLLGDGRIIMVLDVHGLLLMAHKKVNYVERTREVLAAVRAYMNFVNQTNAMSHGQKERIESALRKKLGLSSEDAPKPQERELTAPASKIAFAEATQEERQEPERILVSTAGQDVAVLETPSSASSPDHDWEATELSSEPSFGSSDAPPATDAPDILDEISEQDYKKLSAVVQHGMKNSGEVLSQLLGVEVKVSVPEFKTIAFEELATQSSGPCYAIQLEIAGDMEGMNLLIFDKKSGLSAAGELMGVSPAQLGAMPKEDIESVLCELANICGSSILNEFSNATGLTVMPGPPNFFEGNYEEVIQNIHKTHHLKEDLKILSIMADFFRDQVEFFGRLYVIPTTKAMARMLNRL